MGQRPSRPAAASPSAAFGRLRIDSPRNRPSSIRRLAQLRQQERSPIASTKPNYRSLTDSPSSSSASSVSTLDTSPPLIVWIGPALVCALMYALYNIFIKKGSATVHPVLGGVILQLVAALLGAILLAGIIIRDNGTHDLEHDAEGIKWAIFAGIAVGTAEILSFIVSGMGVQAMQSIPIIIGGSVLFGTILGFVILHEVLSTRGCIGVAMIAGGIALVGTDPGGAESMG